MKQKELTQMTTAEFCTSLSLLLHGGLPLSDSVWLLQQETDTHMGESLTRLGQLLDEGSTLSAAMEAVGIFPTYVTAMTRIGEETGRLEEALSALGDYYLENAKTVRQLKNALAYPSMILLLMTVVIGVLLTKVLPVFDGVYASFGSRLTGVSASLLYLGQGLNAAMPVLLGVLAAGIGIVLAVCRIPAFREGLVKRWQQWFGDRGIARKFNNARFARGLSMGISSGLPLQEAARLAEDLLTGGKDRAVRCRQALEQDMDLTDALRAGELLPGWAVRMIAAGVRGGNGDRVLEEVSSRLMEEARISLEETAAKVEPAMVLVCAGLVGAILLSAMLPLMNIMASIG